jgi:plasmid stabilization system protein ParE
MSFHVVYLPEAEDDIDAAYTWYEAQRQGLGDRFLDALYAVVSNIRDYSQIFGVIRGDIRAATLKRFPYVVYFRDRGADILVIAVQHGRRSSRAWQRRAPKIPD